MASGVPIIRAAPGAPSAPQGVTQEALDVWNKAVAKDPSLASLGQPVSVQTQVVAGCNYTFKFGNGQEVVIFSQPWTNTLQITKKPAGLAPQPSGQVARAAPIICGAPSAPQGVTQEDLDVWNKAVAQDPSLASLGRPVSVQRQVVAGCFYTFKFTNGQEVEILQDLEQKVMVTKKPAGAAPLPTRQVVPSAPVIVGAPSAPQGVTQEDLDVWNKAVAQDPSLASLGRPVSVQRQVVAGCFYTFKFTNGQEVEILQDLDQTVKVTKKPAGATTIIGTGATVGAIGPAWTRGEIEKPAGMKNMGSYSVLVYTAEQQARLGVDEQGRKKATVVVNPAPYPAPMPAAPYPSVPGDPLGPRRANIAPGAFDIGTWGSHEDSVGIDILRGKPPNVSDAHVIIKAFNANPQPFASFLDYDWLGASARNVLMRLADRQHKAGADDLKINLSLGELESLIGKELVASLTSLFDGPIDEVKIRRVESNGAKHVINFHTDVSLRTMQVALNGEDEYEGGRLMYATCDGVQQPVRKAGSVTIHDNTIPHGVSSMISGTRYGLFFLTSDPKLAYLGA